MHLSSLPGLFFYRYYTKYISKPMIAFPHNHCRNNEKGMNPATMTVINTGRKIAERRSNQRPPFLKPFTQPIQQHRLGPPTGVPTDKHKK